jgi:hypothetical protein
MIKHTRQNTNSLLYKMIFFNLEKHDGTSSESEMILSRHNLLFLMSKKSRFLKDTEYSLPSKYKADCAPKAGVLASLSERIDDICMVISSLNTIYSSIFTTAIQINWSIYLLKS